MLLTDFKFPSCLVFIVRERYRGQRDRRRAGYWFGADRQTDRQASQCSLGSRVGSENMR